MVNTELIELKKGKKTSIFIDVDLWHEIRKTAIDLDMSAVSFIEKTMSKELESMKGKKEKGKK